MVKNDSKSISKKIESGKDGKSDKKLSCEGILPHHCEELKIRKFSNDPKHLFLEIKSLEDRYDYTIKTMREKMSAEIQAHKQAHLKDYRATLAEKKKEVNKEIKNLEDEVKKNMEVLVNHEIVILKEIERIYAENSSALVDETIRILGMS